MYAHAYRRDGGTYRPVFALYPEPMMIGSWYIATEHRLDSPNSKCAGKRVGFHVFHHLHDAHEQEWFYGGYPEQGMHVIVEVECDGHIMTGVGHGKEVPVSLFSRRKILREVWAKDGMAVQKPAAQDDDGQLRLEKGDGWE